MHFATLASLYFRRGFVVAGCSFPRSLALWGWGSGSSTPGEGSMQSLVVAHTHPPTLPCGCSVLSTGTKMQIIETLSRCLKIVRINSMDPFLYYMCKMFLDTSRWVRVRCDVRALKQTISINGCLPLI